MNVNRFAASLVVSLAFSLAFEHGEVEEQCEPKEASLAFVINAVWPEHNEVVGRGAALFLHSRPDFRNLRSISICVYWQNFSVRIVKQERNLATSFPRVPPALDAEAKAARVWGKVVPH